MNRLYRGKDIDTGEWVEGCLYQVSNVAYICLIKPTAKWGCGYSQMDGISLTINTAFRVDPATVSQQAGLKDKNGVEIYEGDNLDIGCGVGTVVWLERSAMFWVKADDGINTTLAEVHNYSMVIGSIHDNPELIK